MKEIARILPFWEDLTDVQKEKVKADARWVTFKKNSFVSSSTDHCVGAMFLTKGQFRTYITSDEGREVTLYRLHQGDTCVLSASCVLDAIAFDVAMKAMEDTEVLLIPSNTMDGLMQKNVKVELYFAKQMNERFSDVIWTMQQILFFGADKRVAIFLWDEMAKTGHTTIKFTQEEIATIIGSAREVVSRILKFFVEEGIVELGRGCVRVMDKEKLKTLCH